MNFRFFVLFRLDIIQKLASVSAIVKDSCINPFSLLAIRLNEVYHGSHTESQPALILVLLP